MASAAKRLLYSEEELATATDAISCIPSGDTQTRSARGGEANREDGCYADEQLQVSSPVQNGRLAP